MVLLEPAQVVRAAGEHRRPRRRAEHSGGAHLRSHQAVDEGRLAGARRATDDHQEGRVEPAETRQQVVVDLPDQLVAYVPGFLGTRQIDREPHACELVT